MQAGEKRFARRLEENLEDDYLLWYDVPIGGTGHHPDFIVLHPRRGLLVLEVKDWKRDTLRNIDKTRAVLMTQTGLKEVANPFEQSRVYAQEIATLLQRDPMLVNPEGPHRGRLVLPWSHGVVLSNITRKQFDEGDLGKVLPPSRVICRDEMGEDVDPERFQKRLWDMFPWSPTQPISLPQLDRIRWHVFPELRIGSSPLARSAPAQAELELSVPDLIRIMDLQQEQLARSLGEGHRVIHGVAGSGKTMILGYRCLQLARTLHRPILVLCFGKPLYGWLEQLLRAQGLSNKVVIQTFHAWCHAQLRHFHAGLPPQGLPPGEFAEQLVQRVIAAVDRGLIPRAQYGAVLIDEGHDFQPEWFKLISQMVDPGTNSLLLLYDDAQTIYPHKRFSFRSVGIQAQGRTTILRLNYRNTADILQFAADFAREVLTPSDADEDGVPLVQPQSAGRRGPVPKVVTLPNLHEELRYIAGRFQQLHAEGHAWNEMALLYRSTDIGQRAVQHLNHMGIPLQWVGKGSGQSAFKSSEASVKVLTFHSSKGLEFPVVAIPRLKRPAPERPDAKEEARLLYVAMTRAMDQLVLTAS
ncbi:ATP-binding domain-containing protein [Corallococcus coralloides]|nr:ATP-binding domain-containing protein [Corallococcus coralloides]